MAEAAIVLLAGGRATRFPGKLEHRIAGVPMIERVFRTVRETQWPVYVAANASFSPNVDAALDAPMLVDRRPERGPLGALVSACTAVRAPWIFAVAADLPHLESHVLQALFGARRRGDEAVVPSREGRIEPLAALYARTALLAEGSRLLRTGNGSMRGLIERVAARFVPMTGAYFDNVNTAADVPGEASFVR